MIDELTLQDRISAARLSVEVLERENGSTALDGGKIDPLPLSSARANLEALEEAEREVGRRQSSADAILHADEREQAARAAREGLATYTAALGRCETCARGFAGELKAVEDAAAALRRAYSFIGRREPVGLSAALVRTTLSRLFIGEVVRVTSVPSGYGDLRFPSVPKPKWAEHVEKHLQPAIEAAIQGTMQ